MPKMCSTFTIRIMFLFVKVNILSLLSVSDNKKIQ
jgi:hypothetical protein